MKITIDPGHVQGANVGVCNGYREGTAMYYLAQELAAALGEYAGVQTVLTRRSLTDNPSLDARGKMAVQSGSEVFLSLHSDASANRNVRGVTVIRSLRRPDSVALGKALANAVNDVLGCGKSPYAGNDGGVWTRPHPSDGSLDYYGVIRASVTGANVKYAYLIEHSFHTNPTDCTQLDGASVRKRLADAEAAAIARYFGLHKGGSTAPSQPPQDATGKDDGQAPDDSGAGALAGAHGVTRRYKRLSGGDVSQMVDLACQLGLQVRGDLTIGPASAGDDRVLCALADSLRLDYEEVG